MEVLRNSRKNRHEVLNRIRSIAELTTEQQNDWKWFVTSWDATMAETHGDRWGGLFAQIVQNLLTELEEGSSSALSEFMLRESQRVLRGVPTLRLPGAS